MIPVHKDQKGIKVIKDLKVIRVIPGVVADYPTPALRCKGPST